MIIRNRILHKAVENFTLQLLINKFVILKVKKNTENNSDLSNTLVCFTPMSSIALSKHPKWEKKLFLHPKINALNAYKVFLYLSVSLKTINTVETVSVCALVNSDATRIFINCNFVEKHYLNTYELSRPILIYNINSTSNKNRCISDIVNVMLWYQSHSE